MKTGFRILQVAFTFMGTVVGAGFATGQEIFQFFTKYGGVAVLTIAAATVLFVWLGTKMMLLSHQIKAKSYEDFNKHLFGEKIGTWVSTFNLLILFSATSVMLAGGGSIFEEHLGFSYQAGLAITLTLAYFVILRGMDGILAVNSFVVPCMLLFTMLVVMNVADEPTAANWISLPNQIDPIKAWIAPLLYAAFNLATSQAVLVPLGSKIQDRNVVLWGGRLGGLGIGIMLMAGHFAIAAYDPAIRDYEIPMGYIAGGLGELVQTLFLFMIYAEIFTTYIADVYGASLQLEQRTKLSPSKILIVMLISSYVISQFGFKALLSTLYPLFGCISLFWLVMLWNKRSSRVV
ncbi:YkvI family membrane protein [Paenibacillus turpanensis]|uniref:YkvI family membrane protein n=1 Tax=Paenibacillus turpanensis TaxID=2689078 RepID=UPI001FB6677C|nr:hypothetical protein [Paenibacillus turpanensis]